MVDPSEDAHEQHINSSSPIVLVADPIAAGPTNFVMLQEALLNEYYPSVSEPNDHLDNAQGQSDTVNALLQRLQAAINDEKTRKAQEIIGMRGMLKA